MVAKALHVMGHVDGARTRLRRLAAEGVPAIRPYALLELAELEAAEQHIDEARDLSLRAVSCASESVLPGTRMSAAQLLLGLGEFAASEELLRANVAHFATGRELDAIAWNHLYLTMLTLDELLVKAGRGGEAQAYREAIRVAYPRADLPAPPNI